MAPKSKVTQPRYSDSFNFLKEYLIFSTTGLPTDPSTQNYYKRRIQAEHSPEIISFSVFLHAVWNCFMPAIESIRLSSMEHQPTWIPAFWPDSCPVMLNPTAQSNSSAFSCEILDIRHCKKTLPELLKNLPEMTNSQAAILLITDDLLPHTTLTQPTPFGVVSFFNKDEWESYCENLV